LALYLPTDHDIPEDPKYHALHGLEIDVCSETYQWMERGAERTHNLPADLLLVFMTAL
jgi:hypothetical protein